MKVLAASFVVIASAACSKQGGEVGAAPERDNPPPPVMAVRVVDGECHLVREDAPKSTKGKIVDCPEKNLQRNADGTCSFVVRCAPGVKCNPPEPVLVRCPGAAIADAGATTDAGSSTVIVAFDGECHEIARPSPPGSKGKIVDCPKAQVIKLPNGKCTFEETPICPPNVACNPPAPVPVRCPKGM